MLVRRRLNFFFSTNFFNSKLETLQSHPWCLKHASDPEHLKRPKLPRLLQMQIRHHTSGDAPFLQLPKANSPAKSCGSRSPNRNSKSPFKSGVSPKRSVAKDVDKNQQSIGENPSENQLNGPQRSKLSEMAARAKAHRKALNDKNLKTSTTPSTTTTNNNQKVSAREKEGGRREKRNRNDEKNENRKKKRTKKWEITEEEEVDALPEAIVPKGGSKSAHGDICEEFSKDPCSEDSNHVISVPPSPVVHHTPLPHSYRYNHHKPTLRTVYSPSHVKTAKSETMLTKSGSPIPERKLPQNEARHPFTSPRRKVVQRQKPRSNFNVLHLTPDGMKKLKASKEVQVRSFIKVSFLLIFQKVLHVSPSPVHDVTTVLVSSKFSIKDELQELLQKEEQKPEEQANSHLLYVVDCLASIDSLFQFSIVP